MNKPLLIILLLAYASIFTFVQQVNKSEDIIKPDVFILSGGGNDIVGNYHLSNFIRMNPLPDDDPFPEKYRNSVIARMLHRNVSHCENESCKQFNRSSYSADVND